MNASILNDLTSAWDGKG